MTNVFVHYWRPDGHELNNVKMLFSRVPTQGESIYIEDVRYEVVRVDHHPGKNLDPRKAHERTKSNVPQDAEIWLKRAIVDQNPIRSIGHEASP